MRTIKITENGINMLFSVSDSDILSLLNFSCVDREIPEYMTPKHQFNFLAVEVQTTGDDCATNKHLRHLCSSLPKYVSHTDQRNENGRIVIFILRNDEIEIKQHYQFYDDIKIVRAFAEVKNICEHEVGLEYISSFAYMGIGAHGKQSSTKKVDLYIPHNSGVEELNWRKSALEKLDCNSKSPHPTSKNYVRISNTGTWSTKKYLPMGATVDNENKETMLWQIEANGSWQWEFGNAWGLHYIRLSGPDEWENGWWKNLKPQDCFTSIPVAVSVVSGDFSDAVAEMTKYRRKIVSPRHIDKNMTVIFNDYMRCLNADPTTEKEFPLIEKAAQLGAELYCMDAGWYSEGYWWPLVGEWEVCENRFTGGIKKVFNHIRSCGMKAGIWLEPEVMGIDSPLVPKFEDCFFKRHGKNIISNGRYQLDFRKQKVIDHLNKTVDRLINNLGVTYFKFDYNIDPVLGTETDADSQGDGLLQCNEAYLKWVDSLYERYPDLVIENCASGGMRMDYASLKHFGLQSVSDASLYHEFSHMAAMIPTAVIPEQAGIWVVPMADNSEEQIAFASVNAMLNRMYISGETGKLNPEQFEVLKQSVSCYKSIRGDLVDSTPIITDGLCNFGDEWSTSAIISGDNKTLYATFRHLEGENAKKTIDFKNLNIVSDSAEIIYPQNGGKVTLSGNELTAELPQNSAILVKMKLRKD